MQVELSTRSKRILEAIVEDYIATAEPVGSGMVANRHALQLSSATIRNVMANLEEMGLLTSPHTSAGRIPTDKAYRFYVDSLISLRPLSINEKRRLLRQYRDSGMAVTDMMKDVSRTLASLSNHVGIVMAPDIRTDRFRHIEFIRLSARRILAILVTQHGSVQNRLLETEEDIAQDELMKMSNYLNDIMQGLTINEARESILNQMREEKVVYDSMLANALNLSAMTMQKDDEDIILDGQSNIIGQPEFSDISRMKDVFSAFEQKGRLLEIMNHCMKADGVHIFIGSETKLTGIQGLSLVTSRFVAGDTMGMLGVIGPTRMGYSSVIPIVDYTARLMSRLMDV